MICFISNCNCNYFATRSILRGKINFGHGMITVFEVLITWSELWYRTSFLLQPIHVLPWDGYTQSHGKYHAKSFSDNLEYNIKVYFVTISKNKKIKSITSSDLSLCMSYIWHDWSCKSLWMFFDSRWSNILNMIKNHI